MLSKNEKVSPVSVLVSCSPVRQCARIQTKKKSAMVYLGLPMSDPVCMSVSTSQSKSPPGQPRSFASPNQSPNLTFLSFLFSAFSQTTSYLVIPSKKQVADRMYRRWYIRM